MAKHQHKPKHKKQPNHRRITTNPTAAAGANVLFKAAHSSSDPLLRKIFWGLVLCCAIFTIGLAVNSGINGDDSFQNDYSDQLIDWYLTMGQDTSAFYHPKGPIQYYGGMYEIPTGAINRTLGLDASDEVYHQIRHFFNAIFGIVAMIFVGLLARHIGGWQAGIIGLLLIVLSPRFLGHSLMNPKDIPFAAGYIMAIYFLARLMTQLPRPNIKTLLGLAVGIGIAFGTRAGGLILLPYVALFVGLTFVGQYGWAAIFKQARTAGRYAAYGILPIIIGLSIGLLFWPYALVDPLRHIPESLSGLTKYAVNIRMLFDGEMIFGKDVPNTYLPTWIYNTVPLYVHIGLLLLLVFGRKIYQRFSPLLLFLTLFTALFPIAYVIVRGSTLYDGWRHLLFAYLPLVALVAVSWSYVIDLFKQNTSGDKTTDTTMIKNYPAIRYAAIGILTLTAVEPAWFILNNKDYPYVYFNPLAGGIQSAFGSYETDYWGTSMQTAMEWLEQEGIVGDNMTDTIVIASNFSYQLDRYFQKKYDGKVKTTYVRFRQRYDKPWNYGLFLSRFVRGSHLSNNTWPPVDKTIHTINANDVPLVAIMKEDDNATYRAVQAGKREDSKRVIELMEREVVKYPNNEIAWLELAKAYTNLGEAQLAYDAVERVLELEPENVQAANLLGLNLINEGKVERGLRVFQNSLTFEPRNFIAHFYIGSVLAYQNRLDEAYVHAKECIELNRKFPQAYELMANVLDKQGKTEQAAQYRRRAARLK